MFKKKKQWGKETEFDTSFVNQMKNDFENVFSLDEDDEKEEDPKEAKKETRIPNNIKDSEEIVVSSSEEDSSEEESEEEESEEEETEEEIEYEEIEIEEEVTVMETFQEEIEEEGENDDDAYFREKELEKIEKRISKLVESHKRNQIRLKRLDKYVEHLENESNDFQESNIEENEENNEEEEVYLEENKEIDLEALDRLIDEERAKERAKEEEKRNEFLNTNEDDYLMMNEDEENENLETKEEEEEVDYSSKITTKMILNEFLSYMKEKLQNPWEIQGKDRKKIMENVFIMFHKRVDKYMEVFYSKINALNEEKKELTLSLELEVLKDADLIGMTSTMGNIRRRLLKKLGAKIYILEEAAELLEGQVISCLPINTEHVILIGDHKQLKPKFNDFDLRKCKIDRSFFERMDEIGVSPKSLLIQHRMRPEISYIMKKFYYPSMEDHECVREYPNVIGHCSNLQFIKHNEIETTGRGSRSKCNHFEANMVVNHALYILKHKKFEPKNISILTPYKGQMYVIRGILNDFIKKTRKTELNEMRIETVDDYQGEENDIILVSLVRSRSKYNKNERIGFLKIQNRIIVLLSRAKQGLYIFGNGNILKSASGDWKLILEELESQNRVKEHLAIKCENHPHNTFEVHGYSYFKNFKCTEICGYTFSCGHKCRKICHFPLDDHKCTQKCNKILPCGHTCSKMCHFPDPCVCDTIIDHIPSCGHHLKIICGSNHANIKCKTKIKIKLPNCSHYVTKKCYEVYTPLLNTLEYEKLKIEIVKDHICQKRCRQVLKCGHKCSGKCSDCQTTQKHAKCKEQIVAPCKKCYRPLRKICSNQNPHCYNRCNVVMNCGHKCILGCSKCDGIHHSCKNDCRRSKICGHGNCHGRHKCGTTCCHEECNGSCPFVCSHGIFSKRQCSSEHSERCNGHMVCKHNCPKFIYCNNCKFEVEERRKNGYKGKIAIRYNYLQCGNVCKHRRCLNKECWKFCSVQPCHKRCDVILDCGHRCPSFCTDPCPMHCMICSPKMKNWKCPLSGLPYDQEHQKPIYQLPCGCIFYTHELDKIMFLDPDFIFKRCPNPKCPKRNSVITDVWRCIRYERSIKISRYRYNQLVEIKTTIRRLYDNPANPIPIENKLKELITNFIRLIGQGIIRTIFQRNQFAHLSNKEKGKLVLSKFLKVNELFYYETGRKDVTFPIFSSLLHTHKFTKDTIIVSHLISKHIHDLLTESEVIDMDKKFTTAEKICALEERLIQVLKFLPFIKSKDLFLSYYQRFLSYRLLLNSSSITDEKWALSRIKSVSLEHTSYRIEKMANDIVVSQEFMEKRKKYLLHTRKEAKKEQERIKFEVKVLTTALWPKMKNDELNKTIIIPRIIKENQIEYEKFYGKQFLNSDGNSSRILNWIYNGTNIVNVEGLFYHQKKSMMVRKTIVLNGCQTILMLPFEMQNSDGKRHKIKVIDLKRMTGIQNNLNRFLKKLVVNKDNPRYPKQSNQKLVVYDSKKKEFYINERFGLLKKTKIRLLSPSLTPEEMKIIKDETLKDRVWTIDAKICAIMKSQKKMSLLKLVQRVQMEIKLFTCTKLAIKKRIDDLITREYLIWNRFDNLGNKMIEYLA